MAKFKDFFGNATREFKGALKGDRSTTKELTLAEQLELFGTPEEKAAVAKFKSNQKAAPEKENSGFEIDAWS